MLTRTEDYNVTVAYWLLRTMAVLLVMAAGVAAQTREQMELSEKGKALMAEGKFAEAVPVYRQLLQGMPDTPGLLLNMGMALHLAGHSRQAIAPLERAVKLEADMPPAWLFLGASYLGSGEADRAISPLRKYIQLSPDDPGGHQTLADSLLQTSAYRDAVIEYEKLAGLEQDNARAWYGLNRCYSALADVAFKAIEKEAPGSAWWLALVADERLARRQFRSAFFFYKKAESIKADLAGLHGSLAQVYRDSGHPDWAEAELKKDATANCSDPGPACQLAAGRYEDVTLLSGKTPELLYWQSKAYSQLAASAFRRLEQLPEGAEIHELRAETLEGRRQHLEASKEWKLALRYAPQDSHLREELLSSLYQAHDYAAALVLVDELLREDPAAQSLNLTKAYALIGVGDADKAAPYLKSVLRKDPRLLPAHAALGRAYVLSGQFAAAIPELSAALPIDDDGSLRYELAKAYRATDKTELADKTLEKYKEWQKADQEEKQKLEQEMQITAP